MIFFDISIHELLYALLIILALILLLIIGILLYVFYSYKRLQNINKWSFLIDEKLTSVIVDHDNKIDSNFSIYSNKPSFRHLFLEKLVTSNNVFSGSAQNEIQQLFIEYKLYNEALLNLKQHKPYLIASGIQKLTAMNMSEHLLLIQSFINHPNALVHEEAQYAMVVFKGFEGLTFLNSFHYVLSDWHQLRLLRSIKKIPENYQENINQWLDSNNTSVVIFSLRLIRKFQLLIFYDKIKQNLKSVPIEIKLQIIKTMQVLENSETLIDLITMFEEQPVKAQLEIIKSIDLSRDKASSKFFMHQLFNHSHIGIKVASAEALVHLNTKEKLEELANAIDTPTQVSLIIKHALQEKI